MNGRRWRRLAAAVAVVVILLLGWGVYTTFVHARLSPAAVVPQDVEVTDEQVRFAVAQMDSFYRITDYSYRVKDHVLSVTFYGSAPSRLFRRPSVDEVRVDPGERVDRIVFTAGKEEIVRWSRGEQQVTP